MDIMDKCEQRFWTKLTKYLIKILFKLIGHNISLLYLISITLS